jgi:branched-chain amino acid transport system ATP-binding protein
MAEPLLRDGPQSGALLRAVTLTRRFGGLTAVDRVSIDLHVGEVHAVIGTNGAGKSTLINMLSGELAASGGRIELDGRDIGSWSQPQRARAGMGRSYQRTTIFPSFTVLENCRLSAQAAQPKAWAVWQAAQACAHSTRAAREALAAAGLAEAADRPAGLLSHGGQRQLEIAMCLATCPRVLLLVEHDMDAVFRIADRITVMVNGTVIASDVPERIRSNPDVQVAYLGEAH